MREQVRQWKEKEKIISKGKNILEEKFPKNQILEIINSHC